MTQAIADSVLAEPEGDETWCALYTRSNHEKLVARSCLKLGIRHYLPLILPHGVIRPDGEEGKARVPLFSCYLFACVTPDSRTGLQATKGLVRLLPVQRPVQMLEELRQVDAALRVWRGIMPGPALLCGQRVCVIRGPLTGVEGSVARRHFRHRRDRLVLNVTMLGQAAMLEIDSRLIQPIGPDANTAPDVHGTHWHPEGASSHSLSGMPA